MDELWCLKKLFNMRGKMIITSYTNTSFKVILKDKVFCISTRAAYNNLKDLRCIGRNPITGDTFYIGRQLFIDGHGFSDVKDRLEHYKIVRDLYEYLAEEAIYISYRNDLMAKIKSL